MGGCHSEEDHVEFVLREFSAIGAREAIEGSVQKIAGHVYPVNPTEVFHAPVSGKPCVWYRTLIEEQVGSLFVCSSGIGLHLAPIQFNSIQFNSFDC